MRIKLLLLHVITLMGCDHGEAVFCHAWKSEARRLDAVSLQRHLDEFMEPSVITITRLHSLGQILSSKKTTLVPRSRFIRELPEFGEGGTACSPDLKPTEHW